MNSAVISGLSIAPVVACSNGKAEAEIGKDVLDAGIFDAAIGKDALMACLLEGVENSAVSAKVYTAIRSVFIAVFMGEMREIGGRDSERPRRGL